MATLMNGLHRLGITMDAKRIGIERCLNAVFVQDSQNSPDTGPAAVIVLARRPAIVERDDIVFLDRIRSADMMRAPMLGIGNLSPGFQISRQSDGHSSAVRPFDFYLLGLRVDVIEIIMRRLHVRETSFEKTLISLPLGYMESPSYCQ